MPYLYNPDAANLGSYTGFFYFGFAGLGVVLTFLTAPEMKGRTLKDIDTMFDQRVPTRKFKHWQLDEIALSGD
jgi:hypothetical protein